jgi:group I intron endonuclease
MQLCLIYKIINSQNNKIYIGQTWGVLKKRLKDHKYDTKSCVKLSRAFKKYKKENFSIVLITVCGTQETADYWEKYFIEYYNSIKNGYNIRGGGSRGKHSEQSKRKISNSRKGAKCPHSIETKQKISVALKGNKNNANNKGNLGKKLSEETKQKISETNKGMQLSEEQKEKLGKVFRGKTWKIINGKRVWNLE